MDLSDDMNVWSWTPFFFWCGSMRCINLGMIYFDNFIYWWEYSECMANGVVQVSPSPRVLQRDE